MNDATLVTAATDPQQTRIFSNNHRGVSSLLYSCQQGDVDRVRSILRVQPDAHLERDRTGKSALHYCCTSDQVTAAQAADVLVMAAPDLMESRDEDGFTPLHLAVIAGNMPLITFLLANNADVNAVDNEKHTVVHWATVCGETVALQAVLAAGAPVSTPDVHGGYPLHYAAQMCGGEKDSHLGLQVLQTLLSHQDISVTVEDGDGRQPLLWAASAGSAKAMLALIRAGTSVESHDKDGLTALHCTASRGHTDCIDTLLSLCGASPDVIDTNGCTALHYAVTLGHADATALLLAHSANPNRQDRKGRSPAHCGCAKGQLETVKLLGSHGANLWLRNARGDLPLHEAAASGRRDLVKWLLEARPSQVNSRNNDGRCPLHLAALNDNTDMCKILLDAGAQVNPVLRTSKNVLMTPLDCSLQRGFRATAKYLQLHGGIPANRLAEVSQNLGKESAGSLHIRDDVTLWGDSSTESEREDVDRVKPKSKRKYKRKFGYKFENKKEQPLSMSDYESSKTTNEKSKRKNGSINHKVNLSGFGGSPRQGEILIYTNEVNINDRNGNIKIQQNSEFEVQELFKLTKELDQDFVGVDKTSSNSAKSIQSGKNNKRPKSAKHGRPQDKKENEAPNIKHENAAAIGKNLLSNEAESHSNGNIDLDKIEIQQSLDQHSARSNTSYEDEDHKELIVEASIHLPPKQVHQETEVQVVQENHKLADLAAEGDPKIKKSTVEDSKAVETQQSVTEIPKELPELPAKSEAVDSQAENQEIDKLEKTIDVEVVEKKKEEPQENPKQEEPPQEDIKQEIVVKEEEVQEEVKQEEVKQESEKHEEVKQENINHTDLDEKKGEESKDEKIEHDDLAENKNETAEVIENTKTDDYTTVDTIKKSGSTLEAGQVPDDQVTSDTVAPDEASASEVDKKEFTTEPFTESSKKQAKPEETESKDISVEGKSKKPKDKITPKEEKQNGKSSKPKQSSKVVKPKAVQKMKPNKISDGKTTPKTLIQEQSQKSSSLQNSSNDVKSSEESETELSPNSSSSLNVAGKSHRSFQILDDVVPPKSKVRKSANRRHSSKKQRSKSEENKVNDKAGERERLKRSKIPTPILSTSIPMSRSEKNLNSSDYNIDANMGLKIPSLPNIYNSNYGKHPPRSISNSSVPIVNSMYSDNDRESGSELEDISSATKRKRLRKRSKNRESKSAGSDYESSNLIDSGFEPSPRSTRIPKWKNISERGVNMTTVTQTIQSNIRRYHLERKIFQHLLDLKRLQIRSGQHNEQVLVKRAIDAYHRSCAATVGAGRYSSDDLSFKSFEHFLYNSLRKIQRNGFEHLNGLPEAPRNALFCTQKTHRCDHATHAYTGVPCAAYLPKMDHHSIPKIGFDDCKPSSGFLPKITSKNAVTLELCHGNDKQVISLPAERLDQNKRYYVTFTVKGNENNSSNEGVTAKEESAGHMHSKSD